MPRETASSDSDPRVVDLSTRQHRRVRQESDPAQNIGDLKKFEQTQDEDDYRHRMLTNAVAVLFLIVLVAAGIWIADTMASVRNIQDCVMSGRRGCAPVDAKPQPRL